MRSAAESHAWLPEGETPIGTATASSTRTEPVDRKPPKIASRASEPKLLAHNGVPDLAQLELVGTKVYVDRKTGTIWFQVMHPGSSSD
jgi:hypothetical protein